MPASPATSSRVSRVLWFLAMSVVVAAGAFFALLLAIRFVAFPQIESRRGDIAQWVSGRVGQPVEIDAIKTGWDGWNPKLEVRGFRVRDRHLPASWQPPCCVVWRAPRAG